MLNEGLPRQFVWDTHAIGENDDVFLGNQIPALEEAIQIADIAPHDPTAENDGVIIGPFFGFKLLERINVSAHRFRKIFGVLFGVPC